MPSPECRFVDLTEQSYQNPITASCTWRQSTKARSLEGAYERMEEMSHLKTPWKFLELRLCSMWQKKCRDIERFWNYFPHQSISFFSECRVRHRIYVLLAVLRATMCVSRRFDCFSHKTTRFITVVAVSNDRKKISFWGDFSNCFHWFCEEILMKIFPASFRLEKDLNDINCSITASDRKHS